MVKEKLEHLYDLPNYTELDNVKREDLILNNALLVNKNGILYILHNNPHCDGNRPSLNDYKGRKYSWQLTNYEKFLNSFEIITPQVLTSEINIILW
jgi:hypothetical protein